MKVEEFLNKISYENDPNYVPSVFALNFINFIKLVNGAEGEENKTPVIHYKILDSIVNKYFSKRIRIRLINMLFRGSGKTTLMAEYFILYVATYGEIEGFGQIDLGIYVSDSIENGVKNMRKNLEHRWENSDFLKEYVPETRFTDIRWEFKNIEGKVVVFKGYGAKTGVRGTKEMAKRPQIALLDDLVSDEDARSETVISSIEDTVHKAVEFALHPEKSAVVWLGTPFNSRDPLYKAIESGAYTVNVFPICEQFPCSREEFRGAWEDRFDYDYVEAAYNSAVKLGKVNTFNQELMLRIISDEERLIAPSDISWYKHKHVLDNLDAFNIYITTDFAFSTKKSADFSVISVWALNANGDWFWVDGIVKRQLMNANIDDLFTLVQKYKPLEVGIEISGQQKGLISLITDQMATRRCWFTIAREKNSLEAGLRPTTDKMSRFLIILPMFKSHKMYFPSELKQSSTLIEIMTELELATLTGFKSKHDDAIDTISMLSVLNTWKPSNEVSMKKMTSDNERDVWGIDEFEDDSHSLALSSYIV
jgi:predicted phage terminase large subunit-like protein